MGGDLRPGRGLLAVLEHGGAGSISEIQNWVQFGRVQRPVPEGTAVYDRIYPLYTGLYRSLTGAFDEVARLQDELGFQQGTT